MPYYDSIELDKISGFSLSEIPMEPETLLRLKAHNINEQQKMKEIGWFEENESTVKTDCNNCGSCHDCYQAKNSLLFLVFRQSIH